LFLSRVSTLTRDIDVAILSVCLSVLHDVHVPVFYGNGLPKLLTEVYCHLAMDHRGHFLCNY